MDGDAAVTRRVVIGGAAVLAMSEGGAARPVSPPAPQSVLDAAESDPVRLAWMQGSPPPPERLVRFADGSSSRFPQLRWSYSHIRELSPTAEVRRSGAVWVLPTAIRDDIDQVSFQPMANSGFDAPMTWLQSLVANYTDGICVLHRGRIVYERYFGALTADRAHIAFSCTKSFVGVLVLALAEDGRIDVEAPVAHYLPELANSGFGAARVRNLLDMRSGIKFDEDYTSATAEVAHYALATGCFAPRPAGYAGPGNLAAYLPTIGQEAAPGGRFHYQTANTEVLAWLLRRVSGAPVRDLLAARIWGPLGMEQDGYFMVDENGFDIGGGGFNAALRDMARFGEAMRLGGVGNGQRFLSAAAVADIAKGGDPAAFAQAGYDRLPGGSYRSQWWHTGNAHGAYSARGIHGQAIYIDPKAEMVIARFASHPAAANAAIDPTSLPAYRALAEHLLRG